MRGNPCLGEQVGYGAEQVFGVKVLVDPDLKLKAGMAANVDFGVKGRAD